MDESRKGYQFHNPNAEGFSSYDNWINYAFIWSISARVVAVGGK